MTILLFVSTIVLNFSGIAFAAVYIWLNAFSKIKDVDARNASIIKTSKVSMGLSLIFALLSCLLASSDIVDDAIARAHVLYSIIAISWLIVLLGCGIAMLVAFISKSDFKTNLLKSIKKIFVIAVVGALAGVVFSWLLG